MGIDGGEKWQCHLTRVACSHISYLNWRQQEPLGRCHNTFPIAISNFKVFSVWIDAIAFDGNKQLKCLLKSAIHAITKAQKCIWSNTNKNNSNNKKLKRSQHHAFMARAYNDTEQKFKKWAKMQVIECETFRWLYCAVLFRLVHCKCSVIPMAKRHLAHDKLLSRWNCSIEVWFLSAEQLIVTQRWNGVLLQQTGWLCK